MTYIIIFLREIYTLFIEMAPYLILGMTIAGLLSVFIRRDMVARHVGKASLGSVFKAALLGVPLPLCSCGVIPTASYLKKYGASKPAVMSFLISTPQTGVDSLIATWGMLGPLFAVFRGITALITGIAGGVISYLFDGRDRERKGASQDGNQPTEKRGLRHFISFAYGESVDDIAVNFVIGLSLAALISLLIPDNFFEGTLLGGDFLSMLLMVAIGVPMYVCSTSSIPIAVALIAKGFSPGAAYVFLVAGPATNAATLAILTRILGRKQTLSYLLTIIGGSLIFGAAMNGLTAWTGWEFAGSAMAHHGTFSPLDYLLALFFAILLALSFYRRLFHGREESCQIDDTPGNREETVTIAIEGMSCHHCTATVKDALESVEGAREVEVDLQSKTAIVKGTADGEKLKEAVVTAGYKVV